MKEAEIKAASSEELVRRFEQVAQERGIALWNNNPRSANKAFDEETVILRELEVRDSDAMKLLLPLLNAADPWVRCDSAIPLLFFAPVDGELALERITQEEQRSLRATATLTLDQWRKGKLKRWWLRVQD